MIIPRISFLFLVFTRMRADISFANRSFQRRQSQAHNWIACRLVSGASCNVSGKAWEFSVSSLCPSQIVLTPKSQTAVFERLVARWCILFECCRILTIDSLIDCQLGDWLIFWSILCVSKNLWYLSLQRTAITSNSWSLSLCLLLCFVADFMLRKWRRGKTKFFSGFVGQMLPIHA